MGNGDGWLYCGSGDRQRSRICYGDLLQPTGSCLGSDKIEESAQCQIL
jgi:hypothetical protein